MKTLQIQELPITELKPYENNPRNNDNAVASVANSIKTFGFKVPIIVDKNNVIVCGHTRYRAAQKLKLDSVPCIVADLTPEKIKAFRLADNKVAELASWDNALLAVEIDELTALGVDMANFAFDTSEIWRRHQAWMKALRLCNLKKKIKLHSHGDFFTTCFFETSKDGTPITTIKETPANVPIFADCLIDYIWHTLGKNLAAGSWCIVTTPRRRHKEGLHFATEICRAAADVLHLPFYEGAFTAENRNRINPEFSMVKTPAEPNCILYDDVISTGETIRTCRQLLLDAGRVVFAAVGIKNNTQK